MYVGEEVPPAAILDEEEPAAVVDVLDNAGGILADRPAQGAEKADSVEGAVIAGEDEGDLRVTRTAMGTIERVHQSLLFTGFTLFNARGSWNLTQAVFVPTQPPGQPHKERRAMLVL